MKTSIDTRTHIDHFTGLLGRRATHAPEDLDEYGSDRTRTKSRPSLVVFPETTDEVRQIVRYCSENKLAFVPSGGRTGYAGAAVALHDEIVINMKKMDRIGRIDPVSGTVEAEAGTILENLQVAVRETGLLLPLDFGARGSCQIGGCISTNAGGHKVIKYGMTRELVLGLEVVTPNGDVLDLNANLHKNNAGYDLKQLFIGAEGTLGIVTRAILKIVPPPQHLELALLGFDSIDDILKLLKHARLEGLDITAFEFMSRACVDAVRTYRPQSLSPFATGYDYYALLEVDAGSDPILMGFLETTGTSAGLKDAFIADSAERFKALWALRDTISESIFHMGRFHKSDVAIPVSSMPSFVSDLLTVVKDGFSGFEVFLFGHIGDGNLHVNLVDRSNDDTGRFEPAAQALEARLCGLIQRYRGSISAEHGIGLLKKHLLAAHRPSVDLDLMRRIKRVLDPQNLCNPGKILD